MTLGAAKILAMQLTPTEIIDLLGGTAEVARMLEISMPSVSDWRKNGIPEPRLIELGAEIERRSGGAFSRAAHWPQKYARIWPELVPAGQATA